MIKFFKLLKVETKIIEKGKRFYNFFLDFKWTIGKHFEILLLGIGSSNFLARLLVCSDSLFLYFRLCICTYILVVSIFLTKKAGCIVELPLFKNVMLSLLSLLFTLVQFYIDFYSIELSWGLTHLNFNTLTRNIQLFLVFLIRFFTKSMYIPQIYRLL